MATYSLYLIFSVYYLVLSPLLWTFQIVDMPRWNLELDRFLYTRVLGLPWEVAAQQGVGQPSSVVQPPAPKNFATYYDTSHSVELVVLLLFLGSCVFDSGLFYAARPGDLFKFWAAIVLFGGHRVGGLPVGSVGGVDLGAFAVCLLGACLYFWSGMVGNRRRICGLP